ncbi:hypothetical protein GYB22_10270 [bacterium]|nr:hypothetical protein [bacterium]
MKNLDVLFLNDELKRDCMDKNITQNDLLLLAYNELDTNRKLLVINALESNLSLQNEYHDILAVMGKLDEFQVQPNNTSLQIILEESSSAMEVL